jgi:hypothetical protein
VKALSQRASVKLGRKSTKRSNCRSISKLLQWQKVEKKNRLIIKDLRRNLATQENVMSMDIYRRGVGGSQPPRRAKSVLPTVRQEFVRAPAQSRTRRFGAPQEPVRPQRCRIEV